MKTSDLIIDEYETYLGHLIYEMNEPKELSDEDLNRIRLNENREAFYTQLGWSEWWALQDKDCS